MKRNVKRVLEPYQVIEPHPELRWQWISDLCPVCRSMGGVLLFNRCIEQKNQIDGGTEPDAERDRRLGRRRAWFTDERNLALRAHSRADKRLRAAINALGVASKSGRPTEDLQEIVDRRREKADLALMAWLKAKIEYDAEMGF